MTPGRDEAEREEHDRSPAPERNTYATDKRDDRGIGYSL
jgi:hypothetical protein